MGNGVQCVMIPGALWMLKWLADNWVIYQQVELTSHEIYCHLLLLFPLEGALAFTSAYFSQGTGPIQLDNVACTGSEPTILQCNHLTVDNCGHYEDAGIRCRGKINTKKSLI